MLTDSPLSHFISFLLEPVAYFIYALIFLWIWRQKSRKPRYMILCGYYLAATTLMVKASMVKTDSNIDLYDFLFLLSSICLAAFFYLLYTDRIKKLIAAIIGGAEVIYFIFNNLIFSGSPLFDSTAYVILSSGVAVMIFMYIHELLVNISEQPLLFSFDFWFVSGQIIYHLGSFIIFLTFNYLTKKILPAEFYSHENRAILTKLWGVHNVLLFLGSLLTTGGVAWISFHKKSPSS